MKNRWLIWFLIFTITLFCTVASPSLARLPQNSPAPAVAQAQATAEQLVQQGKARYDAGQFAEAISILQQAMQQYQQQGDELRQAMVLSNLALTYQQAGLIAEANQAIQQSLSLLENLPSTAERLAVQSQTLDVQGRLQFTQGQAEAALTTWQRAAEFYQQLEDTAGLTANQIDQSRALRALGFYQRAMELLTEVLHLPAQVPNLKPSSDLEPASVSLQELLGLQPSLLNETALLDLLQDNILTPLPASSITAMALQNLGETLRLSGSLAQARVVLQQALAMVQTQEPDMAAEIQLKLGNIARTLAAIQSSLGEQAQAETAAALNYYQQAAKVGGITGIQAEISELSFRITQAELAEAQQLVPRIQQQLQAEPVSLPAVYARVNFAQTWVDLFTQDSSNLSAFSEIETLLIQIQEQADQLNDPRTISYATGIRGHLYEVTQDWATAEQLTRAALGYSQEIVNIPDQGFVTAPDVRYLWQWQLGRILKAQADQSQQDDQYQAATLAYEAAIDILRSLRLDLVAAAQDEQFNFRSSIEPAYREYIQLLLRTAPTSELPEQLQAGNLELVQPPLQKARQALQDLQTAELQDFLRAACVDVRRIDLDSIVKTASQISDNSEAPSQETFSNRTALIYPIVLPDRLSVVLKLPDQPLLHYTQQVSEPDVSKTLNTLRASLVSPLPFELTEAQKLYDWLIRPAQDLLQQQDIDTLVFVLDGMLQRVPMSVLHDREKYLIQNYSIALAPGLEIPEPKALPQNLRLLLAGTSETVEIDNKQFPGLNEAWEQVEQIKQQSEIAGYRVDASLWDEEFTAQNLQNKIQRSVFHIVHLVTHAEFSSTQDGTFIVDSQRKVKVTELRQILKTSNQIQPDPIELIVLSACETAEGDDRAGLGMAGVAVQSGARSTLASLWSLYAEAAEVLVPEFYKQLSQTHSKAAALRKAQLSLLDHPNPEFHRPIYWAPFVLLGNWL